MPDVDVVERRKDREPGGGETGLSRTGLPAERSFLQMGLEGGKGKHDCSDTCWKLPSTWEDYVGPFTSHVACTSPQKKRERIDIVFGVLKNDS